MAPVDRSVDDALTSMLRSDYIPLSDTVKLRKLRSYYVDYMGTLRQVLGDYDQLIVGRRGTGKTTLLYRALVECMESWVNENALARPKTLGIYIDVSKCQSLNENDNEEYMTFEHNFASELCNAIVREIKRSWPETGSNHNILAKIFKHVEERKKKAEFDKLVAELSALLMKGVPAISSSSTTIKKKKSSKVKESVKVKAGGALALEKVSVSSETSAGADDEQYEEEEWADTIHYRLNISDLLGAIGKLRQAAGISSIFIFIDEFSALSTPLQGRFSTLARKILGNEHGVRLKICAITDNYTLGSSIILQRDLFEIPLDLDAFVERSGSLNAAMQGLADFTKELITHRLGAYGAVTAEELFEDFEYAAIELSRATMGVPRTLGIALREAWSRAISQGRKKISKGDVEAGIRSASRGYLNQLLNAAGPALPSYVKDIWEALIGRATQERMKSKGEASHFLALPKHQPKLKYLNMFFVTHLLTDGRTTKKEMLSRSQYCFDYGQCMEHNLGHTTDKNIIRQQRFAYDDTLEKFSSHFMDSEPQAYRCPSCGTKYNETDLMVAGHRMTFCPKDKTDLVMNDERFSVNVYTEEEIRIIGAIRSSSHEDAKYAREIADDVGCYSQKVAKFGAKLEREGIAERRKDGERFLYYKPD
jgi:hypothetical protein